MSLQDHCESILTILHEATLDDTRWPHAAALIDLDMLVGEAIADMFRRGPVVKPPLILIRTGWPLLLRHHLPRLWPQPEPDEHEPRYDERGQQDGGTNDLFHLGHHNMLPPFL